MATHMSLEEGAGEGLYDQVERQVAVDCGRGFEVSKKEVVLVIEEAAQRRALANGFETTVATRLSSERVERRAEEELSQTLQGPK